MIVCRTLSSVLLLAPLFLQGLPAVAEQAFLVKDINTQTLPSSPDGFTEFAGRLFSAADDGVNGRELWVLPVAAAERFRRRDSHADGAIDISDAQTVIGFLFLGASEPPCRDAADVDVQGDAGPVSLVGGPARGVSSLETSGGASGSSS
jgi:hypothetical protein